MIQVVPLHNQREEKSKPINQQLDSKITFAKCVLQAIKSDNMENLTNLL